MKLTESSETLLSRYLLAVERHLPYQGRKDMITEIKSNLMDTLEDHYPADESIEEVRLEAELRKLGSPRTVAAPYFPSDALIAPQYNTIFRLVVTRLMPIVVAAVVFAGLLSFALSRGENPFWSLWELVGTGWQVGVGLIGTAAVILMVLSRFFPQVHPNKEWDALEEDKESWKVSDLPELVSAQDKVQVWELAMGIFFGLVALIIWLFLFDKVAGIWWRVGGQWRMTPIFTEAFKNFIPWIAINAGLGVIAYLVMLWKRRRSIGSRLIEIGTGISDISLVSAMLGAGTLVSLDKGIALSMGFPAEALDVLQNLLAHNAVHWIMVAILVALSIDLLANIVNLVKRVLER